MASVLGVGALIRQSAIQFSVSRAQGTARSIEQIFPDTGNVHLYNVARDLWQTGPKLDTAFKVNNYMATGLDVGEPGSFVNPKLVPNMADSDVVIKSIVRGEKTFIVGLVGNMRGFDQALEAGVDGVSFMGGTDAFCRKNIGCSEEEAITRFSEITEKAHAKGLLALYYHSGSFVCPVSKVPTTFNQVRGAAARVFSKGADQFIVCDTTGVGDEKWTYDLFTSLAQIVPLASRVAFHAHGAVPQVLDNIVAAHKARVRVFHPTLASDFEGVKVEKGCVSLKGRGIKGNAPAEELVRRFEKLSISVEPGVSLAKIEAATREYEVEIRKLQSKINE